MGQRGGSSLSDFTIKDSGERQQFESGMVRDTEDAKIDYTLALDGPMFERYAAHLTKGAKKYAPRNWMQASGPAELERAKRSLLRHVFALLRGERDEDHAAAVWFNVNLFEYVNDQMAAKIVEFNAEDGTEPGFSQRVAEYLYLEAPELD